MYSSFLCKSEPPAGWNRARYCNKKVDELIEKARSSVDQAAREKMYGEVQMIMAKDPVWIPIANTKEIAVTQRYVRGFSIHPVEYNLDLTKVWMDK